MPNIRRLKTRREFLRVAAARRKRVRPGLIVQAARRVETRPCAASGASAASAAPAGGGETRAARTACGAIGVGFTASRKVGKAVERNRARRRLRAAAAEVLPALGEAGTDYVLVARKATLERPYDDLVKDLHQALIQLGYQGSGHGGGQRGRRTGSNQARTPASGDRR